ncbi:DhaKLM operon coactivator DhaQ [Streptococcus cuniculipharyngis]|uniref:DhaKLM operon coactivator DhaQ n=1 Tax=Streptococcus cuniculipharyngis TaxID=1562651 RepID=A0A5C5SFK8_9STRE|nr:DhaKLM operon coactivator DhaQ [Streptococcus cuniculipharyngis]TWS99070.1 DhaKLM operon coactivator DhaQ [Streptococcus cuniculipharyngis]
MTFIHNRKEDLISDYLAGLMAAYPHLAKHPQLPLVYDKNRNQTQVPILAGGGSGHEPAHMGFVGRGMLTAAIYGPIFSPPTTQDIYQAIRFLDQGKGVFVIVKNFEADVNNFRQAISQAKSDGHQVKYILSHDDISIEPEKNFQIRGRGLAGTIILHKILGQLAGQGADLDQLEQTGFQLATQIATIGFATKPASRPRAALPLFELAAETISYGIGIHGEDGYRTVPFEQSEKLAIEVINKLKLHFHWKKGQSFLLLVNNLGTTTDLEMGIFLNDLQQLLEIEELDIPLIKMGKFMTSLDMTGISVTLCRLSDPTWLPHLQAQTDAFAWS